VVTRRVYQQSNDYDCGMCTLMAAEDIMLHDIKGTERKEIDMRQEAKVRSAHPFTIHPLTTHPLNCPLSRSTLSPLKARDAELKVEKEVRLKRLEKERKGVMNVFRSLETKLKLPRFYKRNAWMRGDGMGPVVRKEKVEKKEKKEKKGKKDKKDKKGKKKPVERNARATPKKEKNEKKENDKKKDKKDKDRWAIH
jgi:hypothetical protein